MKKTIIPILFLFLLVPLIQADTYYIDDNEFGLIEYDYNPSFWEKLFLQQQIYSENQEYKIGDTATIIVEPEIPCTDKAGNKITSITMQKVVFTKPSGTTKSFTIPFGLAPCTSYSSYLNPEQSKFKLQVNEVGTWKAHYIIASGSNQIQKELTSFEVIDSTPQCTATKVEDYSLYETKSNSQIYRKKVYNYDSDCKVTKTETYWKTICNEGFIIKGTTQDVSEGIKSCEVGEVEVPDEEESEEEPVYEEEVVEEFNEGCDEGYYYDFEEEVCLQEESCTITNEICDSYNSDFDETNCVCTEKDSTTLYWIAGGIAIFILLIVILNKR